MKFKHELHLIQIIRFTPPIFIFISSIIVFLFLTSELEKNIQEEKQFIKSTFIEEEKERITATLEQIKKLLLKKEKSKKVQLKNELRNQVYNAYAIARNIFNKHKNNKNEIEIRELIKSALRDIRFNNERGYFFIYELTGKNILNAGFPELENKNLWNYQDASGIYLLKEMNKTMQTKSETFSEWYWYKEGEKKKQHLKVGFFKKFEPFDWFIGTGEYIDDYTVHIKQDMLETLRNLRFKNDEYIFVLDKVGTILVNKHVELQGSSIFSYPNYNKLQKAFRHVKSPNTFDKGMFVNYQQKVNDDNFNSIKISYLKYFKEWEWVIGTGFNLNTIDKTVKQKEDFLVEKYEDYKEKLISITIILVIILLLISYLMSKYLENIFTNYTHSLKEKTNTLLQAQQVAHIGDWKFNVHTKDIQWSEEIYHIFGLNPLNNKNLTLRQLKNLVHPEDWEKLKNTLKIAYKTSQNYQNTFRIIRNDKTIKWIDCKGQFNVEKENIYGTIQDITERKLAEEDRKQKEQLLYQQSKMAAMGEMIANIAHQWRQPLSVISTVASGIKLEQSFNMLTEKKLIDSMDNIQDSTKYLSQTIDDFRDFFKQSKVKTKASIKLIIEKSLNLVEVQFKNHDIFLIQNIEDHTILTYENEMIQAVINIINNAKDELVKKDYKRFIFISTFEKNNRLIIEIKDNAGGIDSKIIDRIFEPYFTTKHQSQGTGIGLYMTREIIQKHLNGTIRVSNETFIYENQEFKGAKFTICFPLTINL